MLVQVVKEERGTKGAALTTYLSLAGRYSVLMPNTARGGGISRKITSGEDRSRLKEIAQELEVPEAWASSWQGWRKPHQDRDQARFRISAAHWETVRDLTLNRPRRSSSTKRAGWSNARPRLEQGNRRDRRRLQIDPYQEAKEFMHMLMPSHAKNVKLYSDTQPLCRATSVENQLDGMFSPVVQLRSGSYIVLNQAEALVAIDVEFGPRHARASCRRHGAENQSGSSQRNRATIAGCAIWPG